MTEGSGGEPERDSSSTAWASPGSPARPTAPSQQGSVAGTGQQLPAPGDGQDGYQPTPEPYPQAAGQYPAPGQYGPQQWPAYPAAPRNNRVAIAALVCGVGQFVLGLLVVGNIVLAIPALICGAIGLRQISRRGQGGRGMAIAGLVLGILGVVYFVIIVVVLIILGSINHS